MKKIFKIVLVLVFFYQLGIIIIMANGSSFLGRSVGHFFSPVANAINLNTTWNFFSPDPAHTMYIRYKVYYYNDQGDEVKEPLEKFFPEEKNSFARNQTSRRFLYAMRFFVLDPRKLETIFIPWLCKKEPEASRIQVEYVIEQVPPLDEAVTHANTSVEDMIDKLKYLKTSLDCKDLLDEVSL